MTKRLVLSILLLCVPWAGAALAQAKPGEVREGFRGAATTKVEARVGGPGGAVSAAGTLSFGLAASEVELREGRVRVEAFNLALFDVPQRTLGGDLAREEESGVVGFALDPREPQHLRYDRRGSQLEGELRGRIDAGYMGRLRAGRSGDAPGDLVETPVQEASVRVRIALDGPLRGAEKEQRVGAELSLSLNALEKRYPEFVLPPIKIEIERVVAVGIDVASLRRFEFGRQLCVQPVRIERCFLFWRQRTGTGLAFGQPGANTEWAKADIVFDYRAWKTVSSWEHWVVSSDAEEDDLRDEVEDSDCIEVFFINDFDPEDKNGGGVTFGAGTANSQVISSDGNARYGIDLTHLAHELGHVLGLRHPDAPATVSAVPGSTGTLICPSGFKRDNPKVNSQENADLLSNPLLRVTLKRVSPGPDCDDSADCGDCP